MKPKNDPLKYKNYISYLYYSAANTTLAHKIKGIYKFLHKYILAGRIFRYTRIIFTWVSAGTYFLVILSSLVIIIPLIISSLLIFVIYTSYMHSKHNKFFKRLLVGNSVCIIFKETEDNVGNDCGDCEFKIYVIKNPFTKFSTCAEKLQDKVFIISMSYFYSLKRKILDKNIPNKTVYSKNEVN